MNLPGLTAEASLYRTSKHYSVLSPDFAGAASSASVVPAYLPGSVQTLNLGQSGQASPTPPRLPCGTCSTCLPDIGEPATGRIIPAYFTTSDVIQQCENRDAGCGDGFTTCLIGAAIFTLGLASPACLLAYYACLAEDRIPGLGNDVSPCCPTLCSPGDYLSALAVDPLLIDGIGCCDAGEHCVDQNDLNARDGCCPSTQAVCGGYCCGPGESCCGNTCCPPSSMCLHGVCCPPGTQNVCNGQCCPGSCDQGGNCCAPPSKICGGGCCPPFNACCNGVCCDADSECVGGACCPVGQACGSICCPAGNRCQDPATGTCSACLPGRVPVLCTTPTGLSHGCCPPGVSCCNDECCSAGEICCGPDGGCKPVELCIQ